VDQTASFPRITQKKVVVKNMEVILHQMATRYYHKTTWSHGNPHEFGGKLFPCFASFTQKSKNPFYCTWNFSAKWQRVSVKPRGHMVTHIDLAENYQVQ